MTFEEAMQTASRIVGRFSNIGNRADIRFTQNLQIIEILVVILKSGFADGVDPRFATELHKFILSSKAYAMNDATFKSYYHNEFLMEVEKILADLRDNSYV